MAATIAGIATALPRHRIQQSHAALLARGFSCETAEQERVFSAIFRLSGVETRHCVILEPAGNGEDVRQSFYGQADPTTRERMEAYEAHAGPLALSAARRALEDAATDPGRVTHLVTVSCSGFSSPGVDHVLIRQLGLPAGVERTHVGFMGCHGLLNGLRVARAFALADASACVLLCAVELCSLHFQHGWNAQRMVANALFADGAGALVIQSGSTGRAAGRSCFRVLSSGSTLLPDCEDAMTWRIGDHGFVMTLSPEIPDLIGRYVRPWLSAWLRRNGHDLGSVGSWAVHPGGPRILTSLAEAVGLDQGALAASFGVLSDHGNMSSATIAFVLERLLASGARRPCVAIGFGPGLTVEAALLG